MFLKEKTEPNQLRFGYISVVAGVRLRRHKLHIVQNNFLLFELKLFITHCVVPPFPKKLTLFGSPESSSLKNS